MIPKPTTCEGCVLYGDGEGYVPDELVTGSKVLILAQNPGGNEEAGRRLVAYEYVGRRRIPVEEACQPAPLIGATGLEMAKNYLPLAGLVRGENVSFANVLKCRQIVGGKRTNDLPKGKVLAQAVAHCTRAHLRVPAGVELVVAMGAVSVSYMGFPGTVSAWRGFTIEPGMAPQNPA
jgi:uracil-DNA glycosylase